MLVTTNMGPECAAAKHLEKMISEAPNGIGEPVLADESQMLGMFIALNEKAAGGIVPH